MGRDALPLLLRPYYSFVNEKPLTEREHLESVFAPNAAVFLFQNIKTNSKPFEKLSPQKYVVWKGVALKGHTFELDTVKTVNEQATIHVIGCWKAPKKPTLQVLDVYVFAERNNSNAGFSCLISTWRHHCSDSLTQPEALLPGRPSRIPSLEVIEESIENSDTVISGVLRPKTMQPAKTTQEEPSSPVKTANEASPPAEGVMRMPIRKRSSSCSPLGRHNESFSQKKTELSEHDEIRASLSGSPEPQPAVNSLNPIAPEEKGGSEVATVSSSISPKEQRQRRRAAILDRVTQALNPEISDSMSALAKKAVETHVEDQSPVPISALRKISRNGQQQCTLPKGFRLDQSGFANYR
eukprot:m.18468 g.18468  ORF g.18468 m.18468 type:complete len:353 (+) comp6320_c0_seq1:39-1097(+)